MRLVPWYWGQRAVLASYGIAGFHLDNALRNLRVLARHAANALAAGDPLPEGLPEALEQLADAADQLPEDLLADHDTGPRVT